MLTRPMPRYSRAAVAIDTGADGNIEAPLVAFRYHLTLSITLVIVRARHCQARAKVMI